MIKMIKADVAIEPLEDELCENNGDNCTFSQTHTVSIDLRAIGVKATNVLGRYCETCATEIAKRIQESLPEDDGTQ